MIKKTITFVDYDGAERTEDFYFHFSKAEAFEMELSTTGGLSAEIQRIVAARSTPELIRIFKRIILQAYGEKSPDGRKFVKVSPEGHRLSDDFAQTEAYSKLFMELVTDEKAGAEFINGVLEPKAVNPALSMPSNLLSTGLNKE